VNVIHDDFDGETGKKWGCHAGMGLPTPTGAHCALAEEWASD
jgi:hypothetical protein